MILHAHPDWGGGWSHTLEVDKSKMEVGAKSVEVKQIDDK